MEYLKLVFDSIKDQLVSLILCYLFIGLASLVFVLVHQDLSSLAAILVASFLYVFNSYVYMNLYRGQRVDGARVASVRKALPNEQ